MSHSDQAFDLIARNQIWIVAAAPIGNRVFSHRVIHHNPIELRQVFWRAPFWKLFDRAKYGELGAANVMSDQMTRRFLGGPNRDVGIALGQIHHVVAGPQIKLDLRMHCGELGKVREYQTVKH